MNEILAEGLTALVAGMGTVFAILIIISFIISLFKYIVPNNKVNNKNKKDQLKPVVKDQKVNNTVSEEERKKVIAVITVALATSLNTSVDNLHVKKIRRI